LGKNGEDFLVESAETLEKRFKAHSKLRAVWTNFQKRFTPQTAEIKEIDGLFRVDFEDLAIELSKPQTFGLLLENVYKKQNQQGNKNGQNKFVPVQIAVQELENKLEEIRSEKTSAIAN
jgi:hypothetical protein